MQADGREVTFRGISERVKQKIHIFITNVEKIDSESNLVPMIGWVLETKVFDCDGCMVERRGPHFTLGAISKWKLTDEIIVTVDEQEIALRIPAVYKRNADIEIYFDICDDQIVDVGTAP
jgi:hypothetical protein